MSCKSYNNDWREMLIFSCSNLLILIFTDRLNVLGPHIWCFNYFSIMSCQLSQEMNVKLKQENINLLITTAIHYQINSHEDLKGIFVA